MRDDNTIIFKLLKILNKSTTDKLVQKMRIEVILKQGALFLGSMASIIACSRLLIMAYKGGMDTPIKRLYAYQAIANLIFALTTLLFDNILANVLNEDNWLVSQGSTLAIGFSSNLCALSAANIAILAFLQTYQINLYQERLWFLVILSYALIPAIFLAFFNHPSFFAQAVNALAIVFFSLLITTFCYFRVYRLVKESLTSKKHEYNKKKIRSRPFKINLALILLWGPASMYNLADPVQRGYLLLGKDVVTDILFFLYLIHLLCVKGVGIKLERR